MPTLHGGHFPTLICRPHTGTIFGRDRIETPVLNRQSIHGDIIMHHKRYINPHYGLYSTQCNTLCGMGLTITNQRDIYKWVTNRDNVTSCRGGIGPPHLVGVWVDGRSAGMCWIYENHQ